MYISSCKRFFTLLRAVFEPDTSDTQQEVDYTFLCRKLGSHAVTTSACMRDDVTTRQPITWKHIPFWLENTDGLINLINAFLFR